MKEATNLEQIVKGFRALLLASRGRGVHQRLPCPSLDTAAVRVPVPPAVMDCLLGLTEVVYFPGLFFSVQMSLEFLLGHQSWSGF